MNTLKAINTAIHATQNRTLPHFASQITVHGADATEGGGIRVVYTLIHKERYEPAGWWEDGITRETWYDFYTEDGRTRYATGKSPR